MPQEQLPGNAPASLCIPRSRVKERLKRKQFLEGKICSLFLAEDKRTGFETRRVIENVARFDSYRPPAPWVLKRIRFWILSLLFYFSTLFFFKKNGRIYTHKEWAFFTFTFNWAKERLSTLNWAQLSKPGYDRPIMESPLITWAVQQRSQIGLKRKT